MLEELSSKDKVVGLKQVQRAVSAGRAGRVFLACDADPRLTRPLEGRCRERGVPVSGAHTMAQLGRACGMRAGVLAITDKGFAKAVKELAEAVTEEKEEHAHDD